MELNERRITEIVERVVRDLVTEQARGNGQPAAPAAPAYQAPAPRAGGNGVFATPDECIDAAERAKLELDEGGLELRQKVTDAMRECARRNAKVWGELAREDTGMGRAPDKLLKNLAVANGTPGLEDLQVRTIKNDSGVHLIHGVPWGTICAITPSTNPTATVINNGIAMLTAGNTVVFCPHPSAKNCTIRCMSELNEAILAVGGPANLMTTVAEPSLKAAAILMKHAKTALVAATGGPGVVRAASETGKKFLAAGPGNPPVLVDSTANLERAGLMTYKGATFDNNLPCVAEKVGIAEAAIFDSFLSALEAAGTRILSAAEFERVLAVAFDGDHPRRESIGQDATELLRQAGVSYSGEPLLLAAECDRNHPLVQHEQMMPFLPVVRARDFEDGLVVAKQVEHGFRHTAVIHSRDTDHITRWTAELATTLQVVNGPSYAWSGDDGPGYATMTVSTPTGEGVTSPKTWQRARHLCYSGMLYT